jgi:hypothetical protein
MTIATSKRAMREDAIQDLREILKLGDTVYNILNHVSKSGMSRAISSVIVVDGEIRNIDYLVGLALDMRHHKKGGLTIGGCGMDMGFAIVYELARVMYSDGFECIGDKCPANDHANGSDVTHHKDGGYGLKQKWL